MSFHRTRRTDDLLGWLTFAACLLATVIGGACLWVGVAEGERVLVAAAVVWLVGFAALDAFSGWRLVRPAALEFRVERGVARWGPVGRPDRQRRLSLTDVRRVVVNRREGEVWAETDAIALEPFGGDVLVRWSDRRALVGFLRQHHPEVPVIEVGQASNPAEPGAVAGQGRT
ncbi:hypothetical protein [Zavarzinella formosa]|uniref:hypothetical protein n=1 Tax=Zavarzinella formosa TaxID=360055 RepID=UPI0003829ED8|nr:hypothetical protein [Zavarzinella formosa]